ncbi:MAG: hypothetical protein HOK06_01345 [Rhodospirillaceae bacterium]|jgi:hypothetical protein|nr:hypothetical protein [Rhodospirillaceae bacterium]MBT6406223.1 hypothetical protein [Rhodospirillaceae bacterium]MBT7357170.1 hypothetical protein [Rhodospirillaceae bacterium]
MRTVLVSLALMLLTGGLGYGLWVSDQPAEMRALPLCERTVHLEVDPKTGLWVRKPKPEVFIVVCPVEGTVRDLKVDDLVITYLEAPLPDRTVEVECFKAPRMKSGALPLQMPDGLYCNVPDKP